MNTEKCLRFSIAAKKHHDQKHLGEERIDFTLLVQVTAHHQKSQGGNSSQEPGCRSWSRGHGGTLLPAPPCSSLSAQPLFLCQPGSPAQDTALSGLGPLPQSVRKCPKGLPTGQSDAGIFSTVSSLSQMPLACTKWLKTNQEKMSLNAYRTGNISLTIYLIIYYFSLFYFLDF